ncbi:hypothetical protein C922_04717 [Plasmodium inui San Antonio 1]|uniref:Pre-mRNA-splicing factor CWC26 n=1 Tax=Plasmodium inui San Antonio 1 TaxID=1237626 RepID=W7A018_9APIC|nr:hypothetical protein C922_04717 [Plasmodium inui San Antonio 1]EUD64873.1 hypothetical protein C922_04717 [Plasmodium inui San Antonio 1]
MEEYLRKRYLGKEPKKDKRNKKGAVKIYDSEEEERKFHSQVGDPPLENDPLEDNPLVEGSDGSSDIPITITGENNIEIANISKESKKKIFLSLNGGLTAGKSIEETREELCKPSVKRLRKGNNQCSRGGQKGGSNGGSSNKSDESSGGDSPNRDFSKHGDGGGCRATGDRRRRGRRSNPSSSDSDLSLPRRLRSGGERRSGNSSSNDSDLSPPRRLTSDGSGRRINRSSDSDFSPPLRLQSRAGGKRPRSASTSQHVGEDSSDTPDDSKPPRTSGKGKETQAGRSLEKDKNENVESIIYRDKTGKIISRDEWIRKQKVEMNNSKELEWASGLIQKEMRKKNLEENDKLVKKKNIVNYDYDSDYDVELRKAKRKEDPMNQYLDQKKEQPEKATCRYQSPYNRFNILAGYRWDGVVRGNDFEKRRFEALKLKQHREKLAYLNNVSDL